MSYAVARAVMMRVARRDGPAQVAAADAETYLHAACTPGGVRLEQPRVQVLERPPMADLTSAKAGNGSPPPAFATRA